MSACLSILPKFVLPVRPEHILLENHAVVIEGPDIRAILPRDEAVEAYPQAQQLELDSHVLMPGLINMHTHSPMSLLRGIADDLTLDTWLREHIWPAERQHVGEAFVREGTELAMAEMLRGGTTCFNEMYFFPDVIAQSAEQAGMRACIGMPIIEMETPWADGAAACFAKAREVHDSLQGQDLLMTSLAPHALYTVGDESLDNIAGMSAELGMPVYMHVLEIAWEIEHSQREHKLAPLARLQQHGLLGEQFMAVHMAHLSDADIELVAATGTRVIHCPESNLKLASGICRVSDLLDAGANVSVGTDGAASNNDLDLLGELRTAALLAKGVTGNPCALDAWQAIDLITISAAQALGRESQLGTIEVGKKADLCALDLNHPQTQPLHHVASQVVYAAASGQVTDVWVDGRRLLESGELTTIDVEQVMHSAKQWNARLGTEPV